MKFEIVVHSHRVVEEIWTVEADNAEEARTLHYNHEDDFLEEECLNISDEFIAEIRNLDDPEGLLSVDEGL